MQNSDTPKVSLLVPICNVERYLRECLDSAVTQTLKDIEEGEKQISRFIPSRAKLGELLEMWGPHHRVVVAILGERQINLRGTGRRRQYG